MSSFRQLLSLFSLLLLSGSSLAATPTAAPSPNIFHLTAAQFEEPFLPTGPTSPREDAALRQAIERYKARATEDDFSAMTGFLAAFPKSGWRVAVLTNLGLLDYHYGYFSRAIDAFGKAWQEGRSYNDPKVHMLVDRAVGELAEMHARLGHVPELQALFKDIGNRPVTGPATERLQGAREGLATMETDPGVSFLCGPMALKNLLLNSGYKYDQVSFLDAFRSGSHGVSLQEVSALATKAGLRHRVIRRAADQPVPVPAIIHWRVSHFAAIVGRQGNRFHMIDPTFGTDLWITQAAIDSESDGYFLVPESNRTYGWQVASLREQAATIGMGYPGTVDDGATTPDDTSCQACSGPIFLPSPEQTSPEANSSAAGASPMAVYSFTEMVVSLHISDTPVGYAPPVGPAARVTLNYNQREADQPSNFTFFNISPKWTLNWLSYIQDDPRSAGGSVYRYVAGGGFISYMGYNGTTGTFTPETRDASVLSRSTTGAVVYTRKLADGASETYSASNGATTYPRLVFLTKYTDPRGNSVTLTYDNQQRLTALTDATGRQTTFSYGLTANPLLVTKITDPFGRNAQLAYDSSGRLSSITDILGLTSQFTYDTSSLINAMTTPYGTTKFSYGSSGTYRYLAATDPLGHTERVEWDQPAPASSNLTFSEPSKLVPVGILSPFNQYITGRDTFYWDKHAYAVAAGNYSMARIRHWMHNQYNTNQMYHSLESFKYPFENRVWLNYPDQSSTGFSGSLDYPTRIGRVLDDGTTQLSQMAHNAQGQITDIIDPVGRETQLIYAANGIDLTGVKQKTSATSYSSLVAMSYNTQHLPVTITDAAGQTTTYAYNSAGQPLTATDALGQKTTFNYDGLGYLTSMVNANNQTQTSFTYDSYGRVASRTDSEGYAVAYQYDAANRLTLETYPDGTTLQYAYDKLDLVSVIDRQGRKTSYAHDAVRELTQIIDPLQRLTKFGYFENSTRKSLTDPNGNTTNWAIDVQNRITSKTYADGKGMTIAYEATTSRIKNVTDALAQVKQYAYTQDNQVAGITYVHAVHTTPNVSWAYDPYFVRAVSMTDGSGTTNYSYQPIGMLGALQLAQEDGPFGNDTINYQYDTLGRLSIRTVAGIPETFSYDTLNRLTTQANALGTFDLSYLGQTGQLTSQQVRGGMVGTQWSYDSNTNDRRLKAIINSGATRNYQFTTTPENLISQISEVANPGSALPSQTWMYNYDDSDRLTGGTSSLGKSYSYGYDPADNITNQQSSNGSQNFTYNSLNQIATDSYDANGNLLDDGQRTYTWDAENRLLSVVLKAQARKTTTFRYDGLDRRIAINTNGIEARYLWCGEQMCQARSANDVVTRRYFDEGESAQATGIQLYYAQDQLGSVRDAVTIQSGTRVASYDYDPYGGISQTASRISTDFRFAGMFYEPQSQLYLSRTRVYSASTGTWLSRDPIGEDLGANLYSYADRNPAYYSDASGECPWCLGGAIIGGGANIGFQLYRNGGHFDQINWPQVGVAAVGGALSGGLGTITAGLGLAANIAANAIGSAAIGAGQQVANNYLSGNCDPTDGVVDAALKSGLAGGVGSALGSGYNALNQALEDARFAALPLSAKLMAHSNAIHGPYVSPTAWNWAPGGTIGGNVISNTISNLPQ